MAQLPPTEASFPCNFCDVRKGSYYETLLHELLSHSDCIDSSGCDWNEFSATVKHCMDKNTLPATPATPHPTDEVDAWGLEYPEEFVYPVDSQDTEPEPEDPTGVDVEMRTVVPTGDDDDACSFPSILGAKPRGAGSGTADRSVLPESEVCVSATSSEWGSDEEIFVFSSSESSSDADEPDDAQLPEDATPSLPITFDDVNAIRPVSPRDDLVSEDQGPGWAKAYPCDPCGLLVSLAEDFADHRLAAHRVAKEKTLKMLRNRVLARLPTPYEAHPFCVKLKLQEVESSESSRSGEPPVHDVPGSSSDVAAAAAVGVVQNPAVPVLSGNETSSSAAEAAAVGANGKEEIPKALRP